MEKKINLGEWIFAAIVALYTLAIFNTVSKLMSLFIKESENTESLKAEEMVSGLIKGESESVIVNISRKFEEFCIINPLDHENDPTVPKVIEMYKGILTGTILDPEGEHVPSVTINGASNEDYYRYLRNQKRALTRKGYDVEWIAEEMSRVTSRKSSKEIELQFATLLMEKGVPEEVLRELLTFKRIEEYTPGDWDAVVKSINYAIEEEAPLDHIEEFISQVTNPSDYKKEAIDSYSTLRSESVPPRIALEYALGNITLEQAGDASAHYDRGHSAEEALVIILESAKVSSSIESLVKKYRSQL